MVLALMGSAVLFLLGTSARQDAWLVLLFGIPVGIIEVLMYTTLFYEYPGDTLVMYMRKIYGSFIGTIICVFYIFRFIYNAARVLREFAELALIAVMPRASLYLIALIITIVVSYGAYSGIENIGRLAQIILPFYLCIFFTEYILLFMTPDAVDFHNLQPSFEAGIKPILKEIFPLGVEFPYGVSVIFTMIFPFVNEPKKIRKTTVYAVIFIGCILSFNAIMIISTLGVDFASTSLFPLLQTMRFVKVGFIDRIDILIILTIMIGLHYKITVHMYAGMLGTAQLFNIKKVPKWFAVIFGIGIYVIAMIIAKNYPKHLAIGMNITPWYFFNLFITFPAIALIIHFLKKQINLKK